MTLTKEKVKYFASAMRDDGRADHAKILKILQPAMTRKYMNPSLYNNFVTGIDTFRRRCSMALATVKQNNRNSYSKAGTQSQNVQPGIVPIHILNSEFQEYDRDTWSSAVTLSAKVALK